MAFPAPESWDRLPTVSRLISPANRFLYRGRVGLGDRLEKA